MFFQRLYDTKLAQASYIIGCQRTGEAVVVDPNRDVQQYVDAAAKEGLRVTHVTETHIHADFVSGARELAALTGAQLLLSDEGGRDWRYAYAGEAGARLLRDGDHFMVGNIRLDVLHTPGHTPEHLSFLVTDTPAAAGPWGILTGDFVFVGDVGRPDLLERAAGFAGTMEAGARTLFHSLERFRALPDHLQVWPGHGAGSACGKGMSAVPSSTVGYEKRVNWAFLAKDEAAFVAGVLAGQPEPPAYFATMKRLNKEGPRVLGGLRPAPLLDYSAIGHRPSAIGHQLSAIGQQPIANGQQPVVVDLRSSAEFAAGHIPGTLSIPLNKSFTTWAGSLLPYDREIALILPDREGRGLAEVVRDLALIGLDRLAGWWPAEVVEWWRDQGNELAQVAQTEAHLLAEAGYAVVDVRGRSEWDAGHLPGALHIPLPELASRLGELPTDRPLVLQCAGGTRSMIAASLLQAKGVDGVVNLAGGYGAWVKAGLPVER